MALTRLMHAPGLAAWMLSSSADPIVLLLLLPNKGAPVCSDPGQQSGVENVGINGGGGDRGGGQEKIVGLTVDMNTV